MKGNYNLITYGCQMNEHDSEKIAGVLEEKGYQKTDELEDSDVIIINTCCIREKAELKVFGKVGELKHLKRQNPDLIIGICGCMMQQEDVVAEIKEKYRHVDIVFGTHNIHHFSQLLDEAQLEKGPLVKVWSEGDELIPEMPVQRTEDFRAYVSIIYGCDNYCAYCIVPHVRGRERSRPLEQIVGEIEDLAADGVKEIMLLGQNVNSYGADFEEDLNFSDLLAELNKVDGIKRIRYMTSHPRDFDEQLIDAVTNLDKVCNHFHLPVQAGSDKVLTAMNRGYTKEEYLELIAKIREQNPNASITTDVIVGFPGETDEDFEETIDLFKKVGFDMAYSFMYSKRSGTPAAEFDEQIPEEKKKERLHRLLDMQSEISREQNQSYIGRTVKVLVEGPSKTDKSKLSGRTRSNKIVICEGNNDLTGQIIDVNIKKVQSWTLFGEIED